MTAAEALRKLAESGRIGKSGPGSFAWVFLTDEDHYPEPWIDDIDDAVSQDWPMVLGCLLALVREASGDPSVYVQWTPHGWVVVSSWPLHAGMPAHGETEGRALVAALVAMVGEL